MFGVLIPVGPGERELARLAALVAELRRHENPRECGLWVVDDAPEARGLAVDWPGATVLRTTLRSGRRSADLFSAHVAGTLEGLAAMRDAGVEFAVKLDTDVAVIAGFSTALRAAFRADPELGVAGSYDRTSSGGLRDWTRWERPLRRADWPVTLIRDFDGRARVIRRIKAQRGEVARLRSLALERAPRGAHCLGGAYAVSGPFLTRAALDSATWIGTGLGEDVTVGLLCSAAGLGMASLTGAGEPFALAWQGLPDAPEAIAAGGHAIVHSVKAHSMAQEQVIRDQLAGRP